MEGGPYTGWGRGSFSVLHIRIRLGVTLQPQLPTSLQGTEEHQEEAVVTPLASHRAPEPVERRRAQSCLSFARPLCSGFSLRLAASVPGLCSQEVTTVSFWTWTRGWSGRIRFQTCVRKTVGLHHFHCGG